MLWICAWLCRFAVVLLFIFEFLFVVLLSTGTCFRILCFGSRYFLFCGFIWELFERCGLPNGCF